MYSGSTVPNVRFIDSWYASSGNLSSIRYRSDNDNGVLSGLQFVYSNGDESPMFEDTEAKDSHFSTYSISVDTVK